MRSSTTSNFAIRLSGVGKRYKLYRRPADKVLDAFGLSRMLFWRKDPCPVFWALRDFNLDIRKGERVGIIGRNGAGKSTVLRIIAGAMAPTEGKLEVNGRIQALMELGTGFHPEFTGRQNIRASLAYQGMSPGQIAVKEQDIIEFAELEEFIDQPMKTYSAGMYARLAFSAATAIEPDILIIDEVLGAGDAYFAGKCVERMKALTEQCGATVLFVSHDLGSVQQFCQRVVWLERGRTVFDGEPLAAIKGYSAAVRAEEEIRLRARDLRVLKKQAVLLNRHEDVYDRWLFHLVPANGGLRGRNCIHRLRLSVGKAEVGAIDVGAPMDNSPEHLHYLMDTPGYMDWGPSRRDEQGACREYGAFGGKYAHAPFEFAVPKSIAASGQPARLEIVGKASDPLAIELFNGSQYVRLGVMKPGDHQVLQLDFPGTAAINKPQPEAAPAAVVPAAEPFRPTDSYGSGGARILSVRMYDANGVETRVLHVGQSLRVVMEYEAQQRLVNPVFVFCAYLSDGRCATQWTAPAQELGQPVIEGRGQVIFTIDRLVMGRASYVASAAIFKHLRSDAHEAESYHVLDRCIHFQVVQEDNDWIERGLCLQPFEARLAT